MRLARIQIMNQTIIRSSLKVARSLGCFRAYSTIRRAIYRFQIAILMYHRVGLSEDNWSFGPLSTLSFQNQIESLTYQGEIISLEVLASYLQKGQSPPSKTIVITFDDGYRDNYLNAFPILLKSKVPATIFLTTGNIGADKLHWWDQIGYLIHKTSLQEVSLSELGFHRLQSVKDRNRAQYLITQKLKTFDEDRKSWWISQLGASLKTDIPAGMGKKLILSWNEIREMDAGGVSFGAHTVNHPLLTQVPLTRAQWEIAESKKDIQNYLGKEVTTFAYPDGRWNMEIADLVQKSGFVCAVATSPSHIILPSDNPFTLSRIEMTGNESLNQFRLCGLESDLNKCFHRKAS
jgi:peptidoglycan/xylan/chitin deacetylase (PgdA/CDA1 family)